jgi:hypothetical protein
MGLVETKVKEVNKGGVFRAIATGWKVICNYSSSPLRQNIGLLGPSRGGSFSFEPE